MHRSPVCGPSDSGQCTPWSHLWDPVVARSVGRQLRDRSGVHANHGTTWPTGAGDDDGAQRREIAVAWSSTPGVLWFVSTAVPLQDRWRDAADREHFRVGAGAILSWARW